MKCPYCRRIIDGYRGKFSLKTTALILSMFYEEKKTAYAIVKILGTHKVRTNKTTVKKIVLSYENSWSAFLERNKAKEIHNDN